MAYDGELRIFCGNASRALMSGICTHLQVPEGQATVKAFSDGEIRVQIGEDDEMLQVTRQFESHLSELGIPHSSETVPGVGHKPGRFLQIQAENDGYWGFYREVLGM